jgi:hypothetical protein
MGNENSTLDDVPTLDPTPPAKRGIRRASRSPAVRAAAKADRDRKREIAQLEALTATAPAPPSFDSLGAVPIGNPLALVAYGLDSLGVAMAQAQVDPKLTDQERRDEVLNLSRAMAPLLPDAVRKKVDDKLRGEGKKLDKPTEGPKMEPAVNVPSTDYSASATTARRGRPRKHGLG